MRPQLLIGIFITVGLLAVGMAFAVSRSTPKRQAVTQSSGAITGRVLSPDGQPISAAGVHAEKSDFTFGRLLMFPTNDQGEFTITNLTPGTYKVSAAKEEDGYPPTDYAFYSAGVVSSPHITVYEGQTTSEVVVYVSPKAGKLSGRILNAATSSPIKNLQGVQLTLRREDNPELSLTMAADLNGEFNILVPTVPVTVEVSAPGYEKRRLGSLHLRREEVRRLDVPLRRIR